MNKVRFNAFYVIMKRLPIVTNFKRHLIKLILCENDVKLAKFNRKPVYSAEPRVYLGILFTRVTVNLDD